MMRKISRTSYVYGTRGPSPYLAITLWHSLTMLCDLEMVDKVAVLAYSRNVD